MRNPLARLVHRNPDKPTLRERAAALKASAGRVMRKPLVLPEPGSEEAMAQYRAASRAANERGGATRLVYPDLKRTLLEWWTRGTLSAALETGEVSPAEYARLWPMAAERELRIDAALLKTNVGALYALAFADLYPLPFSSDGSASLEPSDQPAEGASLEPLMVRWREAAKAADAEIKDDEATRFADIMSAAEEAIIRAPVASARDLACKIELLRAYRGVHDLAFGPPKLLIDKICEGIEALARAEATKERVAVRKLASQPDVDPVFAAIEAHRFAREALEEACERNDRVWVSQRGGDISPQAMARANEAWETASQAEVEAWTALVDTRPTTPAGLLAQIRAAARLADINDGCHGAPSVDAVFGAIADGLSRLLDRTGRCIQDAAKAPEGASTITPEASASEIDLSGLGINDLCAFYETLKAAHAVWNGATCEPRAAAKVYPSGCIDLTPFGGRAAFEDSRIGFLMERIASSAAGRNPVDRYERDSLLTLRIQQEIACEGRIRNPALLAGIAQAWG